MKLLDLIVNLNKNQTIKSNTKNDIIAVYDFPIANWQKKYVISELHKINTLLCSLEQTKHIFLDPNQITYCNPITQTLDTHFSFRPFTKKTRQISKYPCILHIVASHCGGYSVSIYYDINDNIGKGKINIGGEQGYFIDFKGDNNNIYIVKVILSNDEGLKIIYSDKSKND